MSFSFSAEKVDEGATAIVYVNHKLQYYITVKRGETFQTKFGALRHDYVIGKPYGCRVQLQKGFVHVLRPTPESWTANLDHRTQILYPPDINVICLQLDLVPGSVVVEAGTGSGGLSHGIARCIAPKGHLYTFDLVEERINIARKEFENHGFGETVTAKSLDVCADGFPTELEGKADAVFLDLPTPWEALDSAKKLLRRHVACRVCTFSPCVEQVTRSVEKLNNLGFVSINTLTTGVLHLKVNELTLPTPSQFFALSDKRKLSKCSNANPANGEEPVPKVRKVADSEPDNKPSNELAKPESDLNESVKDPEGKEWKLLNPQIYPICQNVHSGYLTFATLLPDADSDRG